MRAVMAAAVILASAFPPVAFADIRIRVQATVATMCNVADVSVQDGKLTVLTVCNAEHFQLSLRTADGPVTVLAASSPDATVNVATGGLSVTSRAPGAQRFVVDTGSQDLSNVGLVVEAVPG